MPIETRTLSGKNPRLKINLNDLFGQRVPNSRAFREAVGQSVIDKIRSRTEDNLDRFGNNFPSYSQRYIDSLAFNAAGKSSGDVNLRLTGDMLGLMDIVDQSRNSITLGFPTRHEQLKAHGHILGADPGPKVKRDFFGLQKDEYENVVDEFTLPLNAPPAETEEQTLVTLGELFGG